MNMLVVDKKKLKIKSYYEKIKLSSIQFTKNF